MEHPSLNPERIASHKSGDAKPVRAMGAQLSGLPPRMRRAYECVYKLTQLQMASPFLFPVEDMYDSSSAYRSELGYVDGIPATWIWGAPPSFGLLIYVDRTDPRRSIA